MPLLRVQKGSACPQCGTTTITGDMITVGRSSPAGPVHIRPLAFAGDCPKCGVKMDCVWKLRDTGAVITTKELDGMLR